MTVLQIKNGITVKLNGAFPDAAIYGEEIRQGLKPPAFFVRALDSSTTKEIGRRRRRNVDFDVHYFPDPKKKQNDTLYAVGDTLSELFEYVETADGTLRPYSIRYELVDDMLHFFMSFKWFALADAETVPDIATIDLEVSNG